MSIEKVTALLRKAESTDNEHEADAFLKAAQKLATRLSIDLQVARMHQANQDKRESPIQKTIQIGELRTNGLAEYVNLASSIADVNDVKINIAHNSTYIIAFGYASDIEVLEVLLASLIYQAGVACAAYIKSGVFKNETVEKYNPRTGWWEDKPVHGKTARVNFLKGFVAQVGRRLWIAKAEQVEESRNEAADSVDITNNVGNGTAGFDLVLVTKSKDVADFYSRTSRARGHWKGGSTASNVSSARSAGSAAGSRASLGTARAIGGSRVSIGS